MPLIQSWLACYAGRPKQAALDELNQALCRNYQHGHLSRWERGVRRPDPDARHFMVKVVLRKEHPDWTSRRVTRLAEKLR